MMKKLILLLIPLLGLLLASCDSSDDPMTPVVTEGNIFITSNPAGAEIWIDGVTTGLTTPDTVTGVQEGVRNVTLTLQDYMDTTFSISVTAEQTSVVGPITLVSDIILTFYSNPVRIYETANTGPGQPSGLDLSSGKAWGVSSDSSGLVDIYYSTSGTGGQGYLVQSADLYPNLIRETDFKVGNSGDIYDEEDSDLRNVGTWTNYIDDREANYVFLYDHDGHYSKLKIVNYYSGGPGDPSWVEVIWYYNDTMLDNRF